MPKPVHRARRRRTTGLSRTPRPVGAAQRSNSPAKRVTRDPRRLLDRILDTPHLAHVVPRLQPEVLHRVIQSCGLEDCGEIVALATPDQLARIFDVDLWRTEQPGADEQLDADRFGVWLEVLLEGGDTIAAQKIVEMDVDLVIAALAQHALVFDVAAVSPSAPTDEEEVDEVRSLDEGLRCEVGGYRVVPRRDDSWDAIVGLLIVLAAEHPDYFHRVMRGCRRLSNSAPEIDGLDDLLTDTEQGLFDLAFDRERRREKQGYVTPAQARAFLEMSRQLRFGHDTTPPGNPVARAYFRAIEWTTTPEASGASKRLPAAAGPPSPSEGSADPVAAVVDLLLESGLLMQQPRALLDESTGQAGRLGRIRTLMQLARYGDDAAYSMRTQELAYLANTIVAGCSIQARPFTAQEASDAAVAICNLGLENWPRHWLPAGAGLGSSMVDTGTALPDDFLVRHDLVSVFQVGWTVLYGDVSMYAAEELIRFLGRRRCDDPEIQSGLDALRIEMTKHWQAGSPWLAREALDVIASLDMPAWATLLGLIDQCPVIHAAIGASRGSRTRAVSASAFEFISENSQVASVREFMRALPEILRR